MYIQKVYFVIDEKQGVIITYGKVHEFLNANDWYISNSNCIIEIQNQDGQLNCNYKISTEYNDKKIEDVYDNKQIEDRKIKISWGI